MPKINVYLPDDLAEAVKQAGVPVSSVCQRALEQAVRRVTAIRETTLSDPDLDRPTGALTLLTPRTRTVLKLAAARAGAGGVETGHLLAGMLEEGTNLALHVLRAMDIDPRQVSRDLAARTAEKRPADPEVGSLRSGERPASPGDDSPWSGAGEEPDRSGDRSGAGERPISAEDGSAGTGSTAERRFGVEAANALEFAVNEATSLGHNYVGCEHLLLGLVSEPDGIAGQVLRGLGAEPRPTRRAVVAALAGYVHLRAESAGQPAAQADLAAMLAGAVRDQLQPLLQRISRLEEHVGLGSGD